MDDDKAPAREPDTSLDDPWDDPAVQERLRAVYFSSGRPMRQATKPWAADIKENLSHHARRNPQMLDRWVCICAAILAIGAVVTFLMN